MLQNKNDDEEIGKIDFEVAKELSLKESLTTRETVLARKVLFRYKNKDNFDLSQCGGFQEDL